MNTMIFIISYNDYVQHLYDLLHVCAWKYCWELDFQFERRLHMPRGRQQYPINHNHNVSIAQLVISFPGIARFPLYNWSN